MKQRISEFLVGLVFGLGLILAGMTDPGKVIAFLGGAMHLPTSTAIDRRLVVGSLVFGAGWGLAGFCPGPGIVAMGAGDSKAALFVVAMIAGMLVFEGLDRWSKASARRAAGA